MKILHLITSLDIGGAQMMLYKLLSRMNRNEFSNRVISLLPEGPVSDKIRRLDVPLKHLNLPHGMVTPKALLCLTKSIYLWKPNIIQTWLYHSDLLGLLVAKGTLIGKIVWNIRCSNMELANYRLHTTWTMRMCSLLSRFPDAVITNSDTARNFHIKLGYKPRQFEVIPNGFDLKEFHPNNNSRDLQKEIGLPENAVCIGMIARFDPKKDHRTFFQAARIVLNSHPEIRFILCGDQVDETNSNFKLLIEEAGGSNRIYLLGPRADMPQIMAAMDIVVSSSSFGEGFPNVIGEAMATEVPCVVTDVGDSARIVGQTGKVVAPKNPDALAKGIIELLKLPAEKRHELGRMARQRIRDHFSLEKIVRDYEKLYYKLTDF